MNLNDLEKPFPVEKISWRLGATKKDKTQGIALAYIDARDVIERLDEVCGKGNWQNKHPHANGKTSCSIGIKISDEWVWKENGAGDSQVEAEKGAFSDSFKRAAVLWGIGKYLYDLGNTWVNIEPAGRSYKIKKSEQKKLDASLQRLIINKFGTQTEKALVGISSMSSCEAQEMSQDEKKELHRKAQEALGSVDTMEDINKWTTDYDEKLKKNVSKYYRDKLFAERDDLIVIIQPAHQ